VVWNKYNCLHVVLPLVIGVAGEMKLHLCLEIRRNACLWEEDEWAEINNDESLTEGRAVLHVPVGLEIDKIVRLEVRIAQ